MGDYLFGWLARKQEAEELREEVERLRQEVERLKREKEELHACMQVKLNGR